VTVSKGVSDGRRSSLRQSVSGLFGGNRKSEPRGFEAIWPWRGYAQERRGGL